MRTRFNTGFFLPSLYFPVKWVRLLRTPPHISYLFWRKRTKCIITISSMSFSGGNLRIENNPPLPRPFWGGSGSDTKPRFTSPLYFEGGGSDGPQHSLGSKKGHYLENTSSCGGDTDRIRTRPLYTFCFHNSIKLYIYVMLTTASVAFKM